MSAPRTTTGEIGKIGCPRCGWKVTEIATSQLGNGCRLSPCNHFAYATIYPGPPRTFELRSDDPTPTRSPTPTSTTTQEPTVHTPQTHLRDAEDYLEVSDGAESATAHALTGLLALAVADEARRAESERADEMLADLDASLARVLALADRLEASALTAGSAAMIRDAVQGPDPRA